MNHKHFEGDPCAQCNRTLRYRHSGYCVYCHSNRYHRARYGRNPTILEDSDRKLLLELHRNHGLPLCTIAEKFEISFIEARLNLQGAMQ